MSELMSEPCPNCPKRSKHVRTLRISSDKSSAMFQLTGTRNVRESEMSEHTFTLYGDARP